MCDVRVMQVFIAKISEKENTFQDANSFQKNGKWCESDEPPPSNMLVFAQVSHFQSVPYIILGNKYEEVVFYQSPLGKNIWILKALLEQKQMQAKVEQFPANFPPKRSRQLLFVFETLSSVSTSLKGDIEIAKGILVFTKHQNGVNGPTT